jgi:vacuolar-type H+-ATPase subunit I/STV1
MSSKSWLAMLLLVGPLGGWTLVYAGHQRWFDDHGGLPILNVLAILFGLFVAAFGGFTGGRVALAGLDQRRSYTGLVVFGLHAASTIGAVVYAVLFWSEWRGTFLHR